MLLVCDCLDIFSPCVMCVQYIGGCLVHRRVFNTSEGVQYIGGYHEYIGRCSVHQRDTMMYVGDSTSTSVM